MGCDIAGLHCKIDFSLEVLDGLSLGSFERARTEEALHAVVAMRGDENRGDRRLEFLHIVGVAFFPLTLYPALRCIALQYT
jgi:hypothetical protein